MLRRVLSEIRRALGKDEVRSSEPSFSAPASELSALLRKRLSHGRQFDYEALAWLSAGMQSADYMVRNMMGANNLIERMALLDYALDRCTVAGLMLEFGVYTGTSLAAIAKRAGQTVHGFDSFEGLPEDWSYFQKRGRFGLGGSMPSFSEPNVELHKGWFDATLPEFLALHTDPVRFLHVDCDLYSSTKTVLESLGSRVVAGTIIVFDEYLNYPGWDRHEFKAFQEFVNEGGRRYEYLGFASADCSVAVRIN